MPRESDRHSAADGIACVDVLAGKYVHFGRIGKDCSFPGDPPTRQMREEAGLGRGSVMWEQDGDHYGPSDEAKTPPEADLPRPHRFWD